MLNTLGHDIKFTRIEDYVSIPKLDCHLARQDQKEIIGIGVRMPNEFAFDFYHHHVIAIELSDDLGGPKVRKLCEFRGKIDSGHVDNPPARSGISSAANP